MQTTNKRLSPALNPSPAAAAAHQACSACHHQRKKCSDTCELAPYLPIARKHQFPALQQVFGVSNVTKMLRTAAAYTGNDSAAAAIVVDPNTAHQNRLWAVESLIWEAEARLRDPVHGAYGQVLKAHKEKEECRREIAFLRQQIQQLLSMHAGENHGDVVDKPVLSVPVVAEGGGYPLYVQLPMNGRPQAGWYAKAPTVVYQQEE